MIPLMMSPMILILELATLIRVYLIIAIRQRVDQR